MYEGETSHFVRENDLISVSSWIEVILPLHTVLIWDKIWHPYAIIGTSSIFFMTIWLMEPSFISTISIIGLTITLSDYCVPFCSGILFRNEPWSSKKEDRYGLILKQFVSYKKFVIATMETYFTARTDNPKLFYGATMASLIILAWLGNNVNNLFLTYIVTNFLLLLPGLETHGLLQKYCGDVLEKLYVSLNESRKIH